MQRLLFLFEILVASALADFSWTWISGSNLVNQTGIYGTKGIASPSNIPGARFSAATWTDSNDNLWLFGGTKSFALVNDNGNFNDFWKFDGISWTWISGSSSVDMYGTYGTKGVASSSNIPGARYAGVSWIDSNNNLWLFGGYGSARASVGVLNDLWKFDGMNWIWISGSNLRSQIGNYGTKGVASTTNAPGSRLFAVSWIDSSNNLWLFGGFGLDFADVGQLSDLWKFDGTSWIWVSGSDLAYEIGDYGTKGIARSSNIPGARFGSVSWIDSNNNLWLFGGVGTDSTGTDGWLNDLWKFDGMNWTWISGSNLINQTGIYGNKGIASSSNVPGARTLGVSWIDSSNNYLWLSGGEGFTTTGREGYLNDLWTFNGKNWTWISGSNVPNQIGTYGTKGVANPSNVPGSRSNSITWIDSNKNLWLFGGYGADSAGNGGILNDLWRFGRVGTTTSPSLSASLTTSRITTGSVTTATSFITTSPVTTGPTTNPSMIPIAWMSGSDLVDPNGVYGIKGIASSSNIPGGRYSAVSWKDSNNSVWLFGGYGYTNLPGFINDLWKFDGINWTWISGSNLVDQNGTYGTKGIANSSNVPGARSSGVSWIDSNNNLWLFGGVRFDSTGVVEVFNDLWKFDGANWIWISGSNLTNQFGNYGTQGTANMPGARYGSVSWIDSSNNLWLFGGFGFGSVNTGQLSDLWKYDGTYWNWISGSSSTNIRGNYGTKGTARSSNIPGGRNSAVSWKDSNNNFWLFGGNGYDSAGNSGQLNDLWKFDGMNWVWISGSNLMNQNGVYGTQGNANVPGARESPASWIDSSNNLWIFGGFRADTANTQNYLNDLWVFNSTGTYWTWVSGSNLINQIGTYGTKGVASSSNIPGARSNSITWIDSNNALWLFGGFGVDSEGYGGSLNDLWRFGRVGTTTSPSLSASLTTSRITTGSVTTRQITTSFITTSPVTTRSLAASSTTNSPFTTSPMTTRAVTTSPMTTGAATTGSITTNLPFTTRAVTTRGLTTRGITTRGLTTSRLTTAPVFTTSPTTARLTTNLPPTTRGLTTRALTTSAITTARMTTSPITTSPLTTNQVTSSEITSSPLTTSPITTSPLSTAEMTSAEFTSGDLTTQEVTSAEMTSNELTSQELTSSELTTSPITSGEFASNSFETQTTTSSVVETQGTTSDAVVTNTLTTSNVVETQTTTANVDTNTNAVTSGETMDAEVTTSLQSNEILTTGNSDLVISETPKLNIGAFTLVGLLICQFFL